MKSRKWMRSERLLLYVLCVLACLIVLFLVMSPGGGLRGFPQQAIYEERPGEAVHGHVHGEDDVHMKNIDHSSRIRRIEYPKRQNMSECRPLFGRVGIFVAYVKSSMETHYAVAQRSLECYLKSVNYMVFMVDLDNDERVNHACYKNKQLFFKKHCAASVYLPEVDWMLILDADSAVVNPNHCIEEWIDTRVDLVFYERFFNWEIASGNYIARNSDFSINFLRKWGDWEFTQPPNWNGADNGVLQLHIVQTVMPSALQEIRNCDEIWHLGTNYDTYMAYVTCCKLALGAQRMWPGKVRIYRRAHGWVRDGFLSNDAFAETDFMLHGWKAQKIGESGWQSTFHTIPDPAKCDRSVQGWPWRPDRVISIDELRNRLAATEGGNGRNYPQAARVIPHLQYPDIAKCFPHCDDLV